MSLGGRDAHQSFRTRVLSVVLCVRGPAAAYETGVGRAGASALLSVGPPFARSRTGVGWHSTMCDVCGSRCGPASKLHMPRLWDNRVRPSAATGLPICRT